MAHSERSPVVLTGMIVAAIYVIMLIGLTRSRYFIGGEAFERSAPASSYALAASRTVPVPGRPLCAAVEPKTADAPGRATPVECKPAGARTP